MKKSIEEMLLEAANYADAIVAIAKEHEDDPSFVLLADKCSSVICEAIDELQKLNNETEGEKQ
jgi:hypothetical protein